MTENKKKIPSPGRQPDPPKKDEIRLLLVDDEIAYADVLANRLGKRGFNVQKAYTSPEALLILRTQQFDVAVLDLKMPDMDGIELLKIAKQVDPSLQVIMLTGHGSAEACEKGLALGAYDYLMKPCELETLVEKIQEAFQEKPAT
ncbi:MAG TPA: response regulator [Desulfotignum sp.]|nr:response regulator [Desulfotignum sp.]